MVKSNVVAFPGIHYKSDTLIQLKKMERLNRFVSAGQGTLNFELLSQIRNKHI